MEVQLNPLLPETQNERKLIVYFYKINEDSI